MAAVLVLSGCSGSGDEPGAEAATGGSGSSASSSASADATASGTASASASPTPTQPAAAYKPASAEGPAENVPLPVMPELAKQESKEGLEAFAEYWYALINYGYETGDAKPVRDISGPECSVCDGFYKTVDSGFKGEDWMAGATVKVRDIHSDFIRTQSGQYQVLIQISQKDLEYYGPNGINFGPAEGIQSPIVQLIEASYENGSWRAVRVENI